MGLMQFLAVGRSVDRVDDGSARYKMMQQNLLPKFGGPKKPADAGVEETQQAGPEAATESPKTGRAPKTRKSSSPFDDAAAKAARPRVFRRVLARLGIGQRALAQEPRVGVISDVARGGRSEGRRGFFRNPFSRGVKPKTELRVVQTELLLDAVKPVRNDLNDTDLEVVATRARSVEPSAAGASSPTRPTDLGSAVDRHETPEESTLGGVKVQVIGIGKP